MQKYLLSFFLVLVLTNTRGQSAQDSIAIVRLLEKEGATWRSGDVKGHADCWFIRPYSRILVSTADGRSMDVPPALMLNPPASMFGNGGFSIHSNYKMSIYADNASVSHDEVSVSKDGQETYSREFRLLEKVQNQWKIVSQSAHMYMPTK
jgi:hypothetical protein